MSSIPPSILCDQHGTSEELIHLVTHRPLELDLWNAAASKRIWTVCYGIQQPFTHDTLGHIQVTLCVTSEPKLPSQAWRVRFPPKTLLSNMGLGQSHFQMLPWHVDIGPGQDTKLILSIALLSYVSFASLGEGIALFPPTLSEPKHYFLLSGR